MEFEEYTGEVIPLEGYEDYSGEVIPLGINDQIPTGEGEATFSPVDNTPQKVEEPTWSFENNVMEPGLPDTFEGLVGGAYNSGRNLVETGLAASDWLTGGDRAKSFSTTVPKYEDPNAGTLQDLVTTGAEIGFGAGFGGALTKGRAALEAFPQFVQKLTKLTLQEAGGAAGLDEDSETLLIGEDALLKLWGGLSADDSGNFSENLLAKRANIFLDAMAIVKPAEMAARGVGSSVKLLNDYVITPIRKLGNEDTIKKQVAKDMLDALLTITPDDTPEQIAAKYANIRQKVDEYKKVVLETGDESLGNVEITRDTMGAIEKGLAPDESALRARARGLRGGMEGKGSPELENTLAQPSIQTEDYLNKVKESQGGQESVSKTTESIQDRTYQQTNAVIDEVDKAKQRIIDSEEGAKALIRDDPLFGKMLEDLGDEVNIDMTGPNKTLDEILSNIDEASRIMTDEKNALYDAIPDDVTVNVETFNDTLESVGKSLDDNLRKNLGEAGDNFKKLDEFASTTLQDAIYKAAKEGVWGKVGDLRRLKRHIQDEQLNYIAEEGYEAAEKAYDYYKNTYAPFWRDGPLEDIQRIQRDKGRTKPKEMAVETKDILRGTLDNPNREEFTSSIIDLLNTEEGKKSSGKVLDYVLGTVSQDVQRILNSGKKKLSPEDISSLSKTLEAYVPVFKKVDEAQVSRINEFLTKLRDKNFSTEELKQQLELFEKQAKTVEEDLFGGRFKEFFRKEGSQYLPRSNTDDIYKSVFDDPDVVDKLPDLIKQAGKDNESGLRAAYKDHLLKKILRDEQGLAGEKLASPIKQEELDKLFKTGDILFKDNPKIMEVTRGLIEELRQSRQGSRRKLPTFDTSVPRKSASGAIDFVITQIFGVLNRTGARIRSAAGKALSAIDPQDQVRNMMDLMYSNPEEFSRVVKQLEKDAVKGNILTNEKTKRDLYKLFIASNIYGDDSPDEEEFIDGFETYEGSISPVKKKSLDDQTTEVLGGSKNRFEYKMIDDNSREVIKKKQDKGFFNSLFGEDSFDYESGPLKEYPTEDDAEYYQSVGGSYGTGNEAFAEGDTARIFGPKGKPESAVKYGLDGATTPDNSFLSKDEPEVSKLFARAQNAVSRSAIAGLGFDPRRINIDKKIQNPNIGGAYDREKDTIWSIGSKTDSDNASTIVHESIHRGINLLEKAGKLPEGGKRFSEEEIVRRIMETTMGNPEQGSKAESQKPKGLRAEAIDRYLKILEKAAADLIKEKRPGGPR